MFHIHFICRGNVYRSRLAEAYAKSSLTPDSNIKINSSGIEANLNLNGDVDSTAAKVLETENIKENLAPSWQQTTQQILDKADLLVFMSETVYEDAHKQFNIQQNKSVVWRIKDVDNIYPLVKEEVNKLMESYK